MEGNWKEKILRIASYVLVAAVTCCVTLLLCGQNTKLAQLEQIIKTCFVGQADMDAAEDAAARAMIEALGDRWSYYISAEEYAAYDRRKTNTFGGIGISLLGREDGKGFDIVKVEPNGPADKAGIQAGDILIQVDDTSMVNVASDVPTEKIKGEIGTKVTVVVLRQDQQLEFTVKRGAIRSVITEYTMLENGVGYVRIRNFNTGCAQQTLAGIEDLLAQGATALVFDVRNNSGGYVSEMNEILDYLLPEGDLFYSVRYNGHKTTDKSDAACLELPMAVLVNEYTYSAAEFFAAALREYEWAKVVGTPTTGKGYFQNTYRLIDGSAVALSVGQYYTPKGVSLAEQGGMTPDVTVDVDEETFALIYLRALPPMEDPQVLAALEAIE